MSIGYFEFVPSSLILADNLQFSDPWSTDMLDIDYLADSPLHRLSSHISELSGATILCLKPSRSLALLHQADPSSLLCVDTFFVPTRVLARPVGPHNHHGDLQQ